MWCRRGELALLAIVWVSGMAAPSPAGASEVVVVLERSDDVEYAHVSYRAGPGERNRVAVELIDAYTMDVSDPGAVIVPGNGCAMVEPDRARCSTGQLPTQPGLGVADVQAGDLDDVIDGRRDTVLFADGGPGDDLLQASGTSATLDGGGGRDTLLGGVGRDLLIDGDKDSAADGDVLDGREGGAWASYEGRTAPVVVDLSDGAPDGQAGEGDILRSVSGAIGGSGNDVLRGDGDLNQLAGGGGSDLLVGAGEIDDLRGGPGDDRIEGQAGDDNLLGDGGRDLLRGAGGGDSLDGGPGQDRLHGGAGFDQLHSGASWCGSGEDWVTPMRNDYVHRDCEQVTFWFPSRLGDVEGLELDPYPRRHGDTWLEFRVRCPYAETDGYPDALPLRGSIRLTTSRGRVIGRRSIRTTSRRCNPDVIYEGSSQLPQLRVRVTLTEIGRRLLSGRRSRLLTVKLRGRRDQPPVAWRIRIPARR